MTWQLVMDPMTGRYVSGFDPDAELEFRREVDGPVQRFRMRDANPYFNVWGLSWRPSTEPTKPE